MSEFAVNAANGLNGRVAPVPDAEVGAVRADGDRIVGEVDGEWVAGEDGLFYRAEFLTVQDDQDDEFDAGGELPDGFSEVTNAGPDPEQVDPDPRHAEE